jgi:Ca-activated chloride channel family protein
MLLNEISNDTGGRLFRVDDLSEMGDIATRISAELRNEYVLGYKTDNTRMDGKWRKVKVRLQPPPGLPQLTVHARTGYYAPLQ